MRRLDIATHTPSFWSCKVYFMLSMWILRRPHSCFVCKHNPRGGTRNINTFRLNKICKPLTATDSFFMNRRFQILHMLLCMGTAANFLGPHYALLQARYLPCAPTYAMISMDPAAVRYVHQFLSLSLDYLPLPSASNSHFTKFLSLRTALRWSRDVSGNRYKYCLLERRIRKEKHVPQLKEPLLVKTELNKHFTGITLQPPFKSEYSETTHFHGNFDTDNQVYVS
jgi:hypothetical protein